MLFPLISNNGSSAMLRVGSCKDHYIMFVPFPREINLSDTIYENFVIVSVVGMDEAPR